MLAKQNVTLCNAYLGLQRQSAARDAVRSYTVCTSHQRHLPESCRQSVQVKSLLVTFLNMLVPLYHKHPLYVSTLNLTVLLLTSALLDSYFWSFNTLFLVKRNSPILSCWFSLTAPSTIWRPRRSVTFCVCSFYFFLLLYFTMCLQVFLCYVHKNVCVFLSLYACFISWHHNTGCSGGRLQGAYEYHYNRRRQCGFQWDGRTGQWQGNAVQLWSRGGQRHRAVCLVSCVLLLQRILFVFYMYLLWYRMMAIVHVLSMNCWHFFRFTYISGSRNSFWRALPS